MKIIIFCIIAAVFGQQERGGKEILKIVFAYFSGYYILCQLQAPLFRGN